MTEVFAIARNTFKEAIRNRILYIILIFALILIGTSGVLSQLSIYSQEKVIKNLGFAAINFFALAIAVFVGVSLVYTELEKKSIYTIVSKPIGRGHFIVGKYLGLLLTVWVNILLMTYFFLVALHYYHAAGQGQGSALGMLAGGLGKAFVDLVWWNHYPATMNIMPVIAVTCLEMMVITSFSVLFSSFSTPTLSMIFTVLTFVAGRLNQDIIRFSEQIRQEALQLAMKSGDVMHLPFSYYFARVAAYIVPNLQAFHDSVTQAVYEKHVTLWWGTPVYGVLYTAGVLSLAILIFSRRNFK